MLKPASFGNLIQRCVDEDTQAWSELINSFSRLVFFAVHSKIKKLHIYLPPSDIYDICQNVFISIWQKQKLKTVKHPENIKRWLAAVAENAALDYVKSRKFIIDKNNEEINNLVFCYTPREHADAEQLNEDIELFMDSLPFNQRRVGVLDLFYGLKYSQIAKIVDLPLGTVATAVKKIKTALKQHLLINGYNV
ncbi:MAG: sigma-70 family RNA polymerase sigma factor [Candidatus Omnitrophota bacterium]